MIKRVHGLQARRVKPGLKSFSFASISEHLKWQRSYLLHDDLFCRACGYLDGNSICRLPAAVICLSVVSL